MCSRSFWCADDDQLNADTESIERRKLNRNHTLASQLERSSGSNRWHRHRDDAIIGCSYQPSLATDGSQMLEIRSLWTQLDEQPFNLQRFNFGPNWRTAKCWATGTSSSLEHCVILCRFVIVVAPTKARVFHLFNFT